MDEITMKKEQMQKQIQNNINFKIWKEKKKLLDAEKRINTAKIIEDWEYQQLTVNK